MNSALAPERNVVCRLMSVIDRTLKYPFCRAPARRGTYWRSSCRPAPLGTSVGRENRNSAPITARNAGQHERWTNRGGVTIGMPRNGARSSEQIGVRPANDQIGPSIHCQFEELFFVRSAAPRTIELGWISTGSTRAPKHIPRTARRNSAAPAQSQRAIPTDLDLIPLPILASSSRRSRPATRTR